MPDPSATRVSVIPPENGSPGNHERQMHDQPCVRHPGVRRNVRLGIQDREENRRRVAGDVGEWCLAKQLSGSGATL